MHVGAGSLEVKERRVEPGESILVHDPILAALQRNVRDLRV
jgi:hypothetical protein